MSKYTMQLSELVSTGYNVFDDSWETFVKEHKPELCDKILRYYWFYEIGQETPDRFKHYLNEQLARIMPYYNQLYQSELLEIIPLYNMVVEEINDSDRTKNGLQDRMTRVDRSNLRQMADSLQKIVDGTMDFTGNVKDVGTDTWEEHKVGDEDGTYHEDTTGNEVTDQDTTDKTVTDRTFDHTGDQTTKETMSDTLDGTKNVDTTTNTTTSNTRRYSDTPQAKISTSGMSIEEQYLTNYTRENGTQDETVHETDVIKNVEAKETDTATNTVNNDKENINTDETGTKDVTVNTTGTKDGKTHKDYTEDKNGDRHTTDTEDTVNKQTTQDTTKQFSNGSIQDNNNEIGAETERKSEGEKVKLTVSKKGFTVSQSELLEAYRRTFLNIDETIIKELGVNFMGVF